MSAFKPWRPNTINDISMSAFNPWRPTMKKDTCNQSPCVNFYKLAKVLLNGDIELTYKKKPLEPSEAFMKLFNQMTPYKTLHVTQIQ